MEVDVAKMAEDLGKSLMGRAKKYLEDNVDPEFLKEIALDMATVQAQAMTAKTADQAHIAQEDLAFLRARMDTFIAREAIKVKNESKEAFQEVLEVFIDVVEIVGNTVLNLILNRGT